MIDIGLIKEILKRHTKKQLDFFLKVGKDKVILFAFLEKTDSPYGIVKFSNQDKAKLRLKNEYAVLGKLKNKKLEFNTPQPFFLTEVEQYTITFQSFIKGRRMLYYLKPFLNVNPSFKRIKKHLNSAVDFLYRVNNSFAGSDSLSLRHNDFTPENIILSSHKSTGVIDWEYSEYSYTILDLLDFCLTYYLTLKFIKDNSSGWYPDLSSIEECFLKSPYRNIFFEALRDYMKKTTFPESKLEKVLEIFLQKFNKAENDTKSVKAGLLANLSSGQPK